MKIIVFLSLLLFISPVLDFAKANNNSGYPAALNQVNFEGSVKTGENYLHDLGDGYRFVLEEEGPWVIGMNCEGEKRDLVYPLTPPYRTQEHLIIGDEDSEIDKGNDEKPKRNFYFLVRKEDVSAAYKALDMLLWPSNNQDLDKGKKQLDGFLRGTGSLEVLSTSYAPDLDIRGNKRVSELKFKVQLTWPSRRHP